MWGLHHSKWIECGFPCILDAIGNCILSMSSIKSHLLGLPSSVWENGKFLLWSLLNSERPAIFKPPPHPSIPWGDLGIWCNFPFSECRSGDIPVLSKAFTFFSRGLCTTLKYLTRDVAEANGLELSCWVAFLTKGCSGNFDAAGLCARFLHKQQWTKILPSSDNSRLALKKNTHIWTTLHQLECQFFAYFSHTMDRACPTWYSLRTGPSF